jgi:hypothetical protein
MAAFSLMPFSSHAAATADTPSPLMLLLRRQMPPHAVCALFY